VLGGIEGVPTWGRLVKEVILGQQIDIVMKLDAAAKTRSLAIIVSRG
jgi:hypothetical protein